MRRAILDELARGPHLRVSTLVTFGVIGLLLCGFLVVGIGMLVHHGAAEWLLVTASSSCLLLWGWLLRSYVAGVRSQARMSIQERLAEIEDLHLHGMISREEFDDLYAAILSSRVGA